MATTVSLNSNDTVYVTTFYGGKANGRCYRFTSVQGGRKATRVFTESEFFFLLGNNPNDRTLDDGIRPSFDR